MKISDLPRKAPKILLYGPAGRGKTALALTLGARAQVLDLDDGLMTAMTLQDQWTQARQSVDAEQFLEDIPTQARAFQRVKAHILKTSNEIRAGRWPYQALIIDSLTALSEFAVRSVMGASGKLGEAPQIQHWGAAFIEIENVMIMLRSMPIPVILVAHDQTKNIDGVDMTEIAVPGRNLPAKITRFFDEVFYMKVRPMGGGKSQYLLQTRSTGSITCRSRGNIPDGFDTAVGMEGILKHLGYEFPKEVPMK